MHFEELSVRWCSISHCGNNPQITCYFKNCFCFRKDWEKLKCCCKIGKLNDNGLTMLRIKNTKTWEATWLVSLNAAKFNSSSPKSMNPINCPEFFSQTKSSWIFISSIWITTYLFCSEKSSVSWFEYFITSRLKPRADSL